MGSSERPAQPADQGRQPALPADLGRGSRLAGSDEIAAGLLSGFHAAGLRTPDDIAVVGYDDGPLAEALDLTTVRQPLLDTGRSGAEFLLEAIATGRPLGRQLLLSPELVLRSTA